jgi:transcriptional regulator with XRE-family HTH domain
VRKQPAGSSLSSQAPAGPAADERESALATGDDEARQLARHIGHTIRSTRLSAGWTSQRLAEAAGLSQPHLSQLENGRSAPSIGALYRIARALGVAAQELLPADDDDVVLTRRGEGIPQPTGDEPGVPLTWLLTGGPGRLIEAHEWRFEPGVNPAGWFEHDGEDFVIVTAGTLRVEFAGGRHEELSTGDTIWYRADLAHHWEAVGPEAQAVLVNARRTRQRAPRQPGEPLGQDD